MFGIQTGVSLPDFLTEKLVAAASLTGLGERYAFTTGPYNFDMPFENNVLTSDQFRFRYNRFLARHLDFAPIGGPTFGWLHQAFKAVNRLKRAVAFVTCPMLALTAAGDQVVKASEVSRLSTFVANIRYHEYRSRGHELFMESDEIRNDVLSRVGEFLATG
jgi:lysophospholipase